MSPRNRRRDSNRGSPKAKNPPAEHGPSATDEHRPETLADIWHGGQYWAVLWVEHYGDPELDQVREAIDQRWGPVWSDGDLACDRGAAEALDANPTTCRVATRTSACVRMVGYGK